MDSVNPQAPPLAFATGLGVKFYRYRNLVLRHWWILFLTIGLGLAYEGYVLYNKPQLYESRSDLVVREELIMDSGGKSFVDITGNMLLTAVEQLKNPVVLQQAKDDLALNAPDLQGDASINASVTPRTNLLPVTATGKDPVYTQKYLAAVVEAFIRFRRHIRGDALSDIGGGIGDQISENTKLLADQKAKLHDFIVKNNMAFWEEQCRSAAVFLSGLKNQQANLKNDLQRLQNMTPDQLLVTPLSHGASPQASQPQDGSTPSFSPKQDAPANGELYNQYTQVTQQLVQKQSELELWKTVWKPKHPKLQKIVSEVEDLQRLLSVIKRQNVDSTKSQIAAITAELKSLENSIAVWDLKLTEASGKDAEYKSLQRDVTETESRLEQQRTSIQAISNKNNTGPDPLFVMRHASEATLMPLGTVKHMLMGLFGGFILGSGILLLLDRADDRLTSSTEMLEHFSEPILGQIPNASESRGESGLPLLQGEDERYSYAEAFRSLRSSLIFMPNQVELKSILITSAIPNEGKSTIASNLAITMAAAGARVLLVDADLRRGDLAQLFDTDGHIGLSNILRSEVNWKEAVQPTKYPTLSLIARGPVTNQSGELLLKPHVPGLLDEFRNAYDLTIFNTAPILAADDTPTLAPNFDGTLMVVRAQFTSARLSLNALNVLYQRQVNVLGLILNCVDTEMPDYYYYRYPKYYAA